MYQGGVTDFEKNPKFCQFFFGGFPNMRKSIDFSTRSGRRRLSSGKQNSRKCAFFSNLIILALNSDLLKFNRRKQEQFNWLSQVVGNTTLMINPTTGGSSSKQDVLRTYLGMLDCTSVKRLFERYFIWHQIKRTLLIIYFNTRYYADFLLFNYSLVEVLGLAHNAPCTNLRWPMKHLKKLESNL